MSADDYQPDPAEKEQAVDQAGGPEAAVEEALHQRDPAIDIADLRIKQAEDAAPVVEGRVGSEKDKEWALGRARNTLGQEVHDAIEVDEALPTTAPESVVSGYEQQDDHPDVTQGATGLPNPEAERGRAYVPGEDDQQVGGAEPLSGAGTAEEYQEPGVEQRRSRGPDEVSGPA
jgi:hypothetical protein